MVAVVNAIPPVRSVADHPATPPYEPPFLTHYRTHGYFHAPDIATLEGLAQARHVSNEWVCLCNIDINLIHAWKSYDVPIDPDKPNELAFFKKESAIKKHCITVSDA